MIASSDISNSFTNESHNRATALSRRLDGLHFSLKAVDKGPLRRNSEEPTQGSSIPQTERLPTSIDSVRVHRSFQCVFFFYPSVISARLNGDDGHSLLSRLTA